MITEDDVKYVAGLSRIHLKDEETQFLQKDLEKIISYVTKLEKLDVSNVEPTSHALPMKNVFRPDEIRESLAHESALSIAIEKKEGSFKVPKVIE